MKCRGSVNHAKWDCKYHIVWIPKYRKKVLYGKICKYVRDFILDLARQRECEILEGALKSDHIHMQIKIPPKYSVAQIVGFIKGKSAIRVARDCLNRQRNCKGQNFWARGYFASTVVADEEIIRNYIKKQEIEGRRYDQLELS